MDLNQQYFRTDLPELQVGDEVEVVVKNLTKTEAKANKGGVKSAEESEKEKYRLTRFRGKIISCKNKNQISYTFSVLKKSNKIVLTSKFLYHSPLIASIKKYFGPKEEKIRRAKLYYLERRIGGNK